MINKILSTIHKNFILYLCILKIYLMKKAFYVFLLSSLFTFTSCNNEIDTPIKLQGFVFGTTYNIIYYDVSANFEEDINKLYCNNCFSTYDDHINSLDDYDVKCVDNILIAYMSNHIKYIFYLYQIS